MFDISKFVGGIVSPKVGLALIRNRLQAELNNIRRPGTAEVVIRDYRMIINNGAGTVFFVVDGVTFPYPDGESLTKLIVSLVKEKFAGTIDLIIIDYTTDGPPALTCAYKKEDGEKLQTKITL